jgi:hypothetical protein
MAMVMVTLMLMLMHAQRSLHLIHRECSHGLLSWCAMCAAWWCE